MSRLGRRRRTSFAIVAVLAAAVSLAAYLGEAFKRTELDLVDARFSVRGPEKPADDIVVVEIDDVTFGDLNKRWPLARSFHGDLIRKLTEGGAKAIVYDVQFTEPTKPAEDNALISAVAAAKSPVILATEEVAKDGSTNVFGGEAVLKQVGARAGNSAFEPDPGGVFRRLPHATDGLESLSVAAIEEVTGEQVDPDDFPDDGAWIDYAGPPDTVPSYSFSGVIGGGGRAPSIEPDTFRDKIVVVGVSSPVVQDVHPVPTSGEELMPGPEIQANAIATVEGDLPLSELPKPLGGLLIIGLAMLVPAAGLRWEPLVAAGIGLLAGGLYLVAAQVAFNAGLIMPILYPLLALALAAIGTLAVHYVVAAFERQRTELTFGRFVPREVVDTVLARTDGDLRLGGERRECTVLFSDIRGFTTFSESREPDEVVEILNRYLGDMTDAIMDNGGTLISYMGDGIMALFGAPLDQPDHADRALAAAKDMLGPKLSSFNEWVRAEGLHDGFDMGVGLNSGVVMTGQVGSERRVEYTAIGDTTNTAARLEGMTKGTPHQVFLSSLTKDLLADEGGLLFVDELEVRGRRDKIGVWTVEGLEKESA